MIHIIVKYGLRRHVDVKPPFLEYINHIEILINAIIRIMFQMRKYFLLSNSDSHITI